MNWWFTYCLATLASVSLDTIYRSSSSYTSDRCDHAGSSCGSSSSTSVPSIAPPISPCRRGGNSRNRFREIIRTTAGDASSVNFPDPTFT